MKPKAPPDSLDYKAEPTMKRFHLSNAAVKGVRGPEGSGKTVGCFFDLLKYSMLQPACTKGAKRGIRTTRWCVVRSSYPELLTTSLQTFEDWFGGYCTDIKRQAPIEAELRLPKELMRDGTEVEASFLFLALDVPSDVKKLKGMEVTGTYINEATEIGRWVLTRAFGRRGRFPSFKKAGVAPVWAGVIMDSNSCDDDHWWYKTAEEEKPEGWGFFSQPSALFRFKHRSDVDDYLRRNPDLQPEYRRIVQDMKGEFYIGNPAAECVAHHSLGIGYWLDTIPGRPLHEIRTLVMNEYSLTTDDMPVYPEYQDGVHSAKEDLIPIRDIGITLGMDFGLTPACTFSQITPRGQKMVFDEMYVEQHGAMGIRQLSREVLVPYLLDNFLSWLQKNLISGWGDPAGNIRGQTDEKTCYQILRELVATSNKTDNPSFSQNAKRLQDSAWVEKLKNLAKTGGVSLGDLGVDVRPARTNKFLTRKDAVSRLLIARIDGDPALLVSPKCKMLRKGLRGKYRYKRVQVSGEDRFKNEPVKDIYSHINEAFMYDCMMSSFLAADYTEEDEQQRENALSRLDTAARAATDEYALIVNQIKEAQDAAEIWM